MKITLNRTPEQVQLVKAMASKNREEALKAQDIVAALVAPLIQTVIDRASTSDTIYDTLTFNQDEHPSIPLDLYYDKSADYVRVWSQTMAGGLPTNHIQGLTELKFTTYSLDSAVSCLKRYARLGQLDNVARMIKRMAQEILSKQELNAWTPILAAVAQASTNVNGNAISHVIAATTAGILQINDFNNLITRSKKLNRSWDGGTPAEVFGVTDIYMSAEKMADVRAFAYQPMNTRQGAITATAAGTSATSVPLPDDVRSKIYNAAGASEIFGLTLHELPELSTDSAYGVIFDSFYGGSFTAGTTELVLAVDKSREAFVKPVEVDENGSRVITQADDSFTIRSEKLGYFSKCQQGAVVLDSRAVCALTV